ncbi:hypothetical protein AVEN_36420-1, partial [Araneus ventricosus]
MTEQNSFHQELEAINIFARTFQSLAPLLDTHKKDLDSNLLSPTPLLPDIISPYGVVFQEKNKSGSYYTSLLK